MGCASISLRFVRIADEIKAAIVRAKSAAEPPADPSKGGFT
jgi:hypothetical protein